MQTDLKDSEKPVDPFAAVVLNHDRIDWKDQSLTADSITEKLIGPNSYWWEINPDFDSSENHRVTALHIEKDILFEAGRSNWAGVSKWGKPYYQHMLTLIHLMFPATDVTPSLADATMMFMLGIGGCGKKILNLIGSQNSGKSAAACRIAFACILIDPHYTVVYVANPFNNSADSTVYGDVEELWDQLSDTFPLTTNSKKDDGTKNSLFPQGRKYSNDYIEFIPNIPKAAKIELRDTKKVGKYKGSKTRGKDVNRGIFLVVIDEVNEIENFAFLTTLTNISSQDAFFCITSQNFKNSEDMGGRMAEPQPVYEGNPASYDDLDIENDMFWHSAISGITLRFDGHKSPNILLGKTIYPKLFKLDAMERMKRDYGEQSADYFSQVRSFPARGDDSNSVLSRAKISSSRHTDPHFTLTKLNGRVAHFDPAFGGRDKAVFGWASFGFANTQDAEGRTVEEELLIFTDNFRVVHFVKDAFYNSYWLDRLKAAAIDISWVTLGALVSYEDQMAICCKEWLLEFNVPINSFSYDFSMRPDCVSSMNKILGFTAHAMDYNTKPEGFLLQNIKQNTLDCCKDRNTELAFIAADYFLTKQIRCGKHIEEAITQLSRTLYQKKNGKFIAENKKDYKMRWQNVSPDARDVLLGICGGAARKGFRQNIISAGKTKSAFDELQARNLGRAKVGRRL